jgi:hypothetical protein
MPLAIAAKFWSAALLCRVGKHRKNGFETAAPTLAKRAVLPGIPVSCDIRPGGIPN